MVSFGGNDVGFAGTIGDCIGFGQSLINVEHLSPAALTAALTNGMFAGCSENRR